MRNSGFAAIIFACLFVSPVSAQQPQRNVSGIPAGKAASKLSPSQIFSNASHSVVLIIASAQNRQQGAQGSGFVVDQDRIVTNHHVVEGMSQAFVLFSDGKVQQVSEVVSDSPEQDLIILAAETGQRHPLPLGDEFSLREGDAVYAIGAPKGLELSFTNGIVSSFRRSSSQFLIQTTAPIAPGSSGGPLLDNFGRVVGVTTSRIADAPGIYFSVGIGDVRRLIRTPHGVTLSLSGAAQQESKRGEEVAAESTPRHAQNDQDNGPSLEETLSWMLDFSARYGRHKGARGDQYFDHFQQERGCDAKITHSVKTENSSSETEDTFNLRDLDAQNILITNSNTVNFFTIKTYKLIHRTNSESKSSLFDLSSDYVSFDSKESADRFAAALKHAILLCGSGKDLF